MTRTRPHNPVTLAEQAGRMGVWSWLPRADSLWLSGQAAILMGSAIPVGQLDLKINLSQFVELVHVDDRVLVRKAFLAATDAAGPVDLTFQPAATQERILAHGEWAAFGHHGVDLHGVLIAQNRHDVDTAADRLAAIVASSDDAIIGKTLAGLITDWNRGAELIYGYTAAEMIGQPISLLLPSGESNEMTRILDKIRRGERIEHFQTRRRRKDGELIDVSLTVSPVHDGTGHVIGASKVARDVTKERRSQQHLTELQAELVHMSRLSAMGEMASTLAHELNQPLTAVVGYLNGCRRLLAGPEHTGSDLLRDALARAAEQALRAGEIIRRLRDFVRRGESQIRVEKLDQLIEETCALALIGIKETGVRATFDFDPRANAVRVDRIQIQQVIFNLIRNAIEAMADTPQRDLQIATTCTRGPAAEEMVEVSVTDSGTGLAPDIAARLFQPFVTSKATGMGVGLSISRSIAESHGGQLWAEANPAGGTIFRLTLPAFQASGADDDYGD